ncbi:redoxin family protein [Aquisphaera insulae]|uniref:redoxin family protein n=1 Tax=Aquisphaera insulae TaxID=2712864 RepID=UPI0013EA818F|nr:redoxin family protein [Aquisphaera insulae]
MRRLLPIVTLFAIHPAAPARADGPQDSKPPDARVATPAERYKAVLKEFDDAKRARYRAEAEKKSEAERLELRRQPFDYATFAEKMDRIAREAPRDPTALDALVWVAVYSRGPLAERAFETIKADHVRDPAIGSLATQIGYIAPPRGDAILRAILAENPSREAKGQACLSLARKLKLEAEHAGSKEGAAALDGESEALFDRVLREFADIQGEHGPLGEVAREGLFEIHHLGVGKTAPEITGEDDRGGTMKLSEFRGKVVVLDFWGEWCGPCRTLYPFERALIKRMEGKPFVFLGINSDPIEARERVRGRMKKEGNSWRYWVDGNWPGTIGSSWNVQSWPTLYVIDANGVIRHKVVGSTDVARLDAAVESLVERTPVGAGVPSAGPKVADRVILRYGAALKGDGPDDAAAEPAGVPAGRDLRTNRIYRVDRVEGARLLLRSERIPERGWVATDDAIPIARAADYLSGEIRSRPSARAFTDRGSLRKDGGDNDEAIADASEAIRIDRAFAPAYRVRGNALLDKKEYDRALADYDEAVRLDPKSAAARYSRGNGWLFRNDFSKALADYEESVRLDPGFALGYNGIAWVSATSPDAAHRNGKRAVEAAMKAVELTGGEPFTLDTLAAAYAEDGKFDSAVATGERAFGLLNDGDARTECRARIDLYRAKKPYRTNATREGVERK